MGTFCEAFGITKLEAPSTARKRAQKKQFKPKPKPTVQKPKPFVKTEQPKPISKRKKTNKVKKPIQMWKNRPQSLSM